MTKNPLPESKVLHPRLGEKLLIGGFGGLMPLFMNLIIIDAKVLAEGFTKLVLFGYSVRGVALFILGAFWVYLHKNESDRLTLFQLGILAPALIIGLMNGRNVELLHKMPNESQEVAQLFSQHSGTSSLFPFAYAEAPTQGTKEITGKDGAPMVLVPAGSFTMGTGESEESGFSQFFRGLFGSPKKETGFDNENEKPAHEVDLDAFYIDKYEVTTSRYAKFFKTTGREKPTYWTDTVVASQGNLPVQGVPWNHAMAYCEKYGKRLPTEAEWEKAARGTDGRKYPWGNSDPDSSRANFGRSAFSLGVADFFSKQLKPVGNYEAGKSPYGAYDMTGNVSEWVADWYDQNYYKNSPRKNPRGPSHGKYRVSRGGGWGDKAKFLRAAIRFLDRPSARNFPIGFRCAQSAR